MEKEIPKFDGAKCNEALCTKCGLKTEQLQQELWLCDCITTRVEALFTPSKTIKSWEDVCTKLARLYCLNRFEIESGFEPNDVVLERTEDYVLIKDVRGLLLIVRHDEETHNLIDKLKDATKPIQPNKVKIVIIGQVE